VKILFLILLSLLVLLTLFYLTVNAVWGVPRYRGEQSDHFDGKVFHNLERAPMHGFGRYLSMRLAAILKRDVENQKPQWPEWIETKPGAPPPQRVSGLRVTFVNHATVLIQIERLNVLTDPMWSERASPLPWAGPKRHRAPGLRYEDLPPIDVVLLSHNHYDHCDVATLKRLMDDHRPVLLSALGNALFLEKKGVPSVSLDWWGRQALLSGLEVISVPAKHFSARALNDRNRALWGGFVVKGETRSVFFAGDTGYGAHFKDIGRRFPGLDAAILPIGAYLPQWFMKPVHISPDEAVLAHEDLGSRFAIPMHFGTFQLSEEGQEEPLADLENAIQRRGAKGFVILKEGEGKEL
jgi:L-ascorbate metabolism protein UlaG (beta-lactamase superfamily)